MRVNSPGIVLARIMIWPVASDSPKSSLEFEHAHTMIPAIETIAYMQTAFALARAFRKIEIVAEIVIMTSHSRGNQRQGGAKIPPPCGVSESLGTLRRGGTELVCTDHAHG